MAVSTISRIGKITVDGTSAHTIKFTNAIREEFTVLIEMISGVVQFELNTVVVAGSPTYDIDGATKLVLELSRDDILHFKGAAGSEVFNLSTS